MPERLSRAQGTVQSSPEPHHYDIIKYTFDDISPTLLNTPIQFKLKHSYFDIHGPVRAVYHTSNASEFW